VEISKPDLEALATEISNPRPNITEYRLRDGIYPKFNREYYNVKIKERIDPLRIGDNLYTYRSKEVPVSVILYLFGHGVDFEILD
ncbi:MAG TPA: hypothetical protein EYP47_01075, partial [Methanococcaceae archaeon]|nr:hypothetical protein [Methanococcaceae archaeon]